MGEMRSTYKIFVGKPERKRQLGTPKRRWEGYIIMNIKEMGEKLWIGFIWLRKETGGSLFWTR
jgi:hypothetical protein